MAIYARLENGTYAEVTGVYKTDGTEVTEIFQGDRLVYSASNEIYGSLPLYYNGKGYDLTDYILSGNAVQDGTPSADAPVDATGCGVRTANLFDAANRIAIVGYIDNTGTIVSNSANACIICKVEPDTTYTVSADMMCTNGNRLAEFSEEPVIGSKGTVVMTKSLPNLYQFTITTGLNTKYIAFHRGISSEAERSEFYNKIMLNAGSTALPYEPYGFKLPLTVNSTEYPIYLGTVPTTRRIKKLVLTGDETWYSSSRYIGSLFAYYSQFPGIASRSPIYCSHLIAVDSVSQYQRGTCICDASSVSLWIFDTTTSPASFKSYLASQYAAGTPVTVWYVLATPETAIVNEPLMKIGDYADTISFAQAGVTIPTVSGANVLDMSSPVKPSEMYIKGKGIKPTGYGQLTDVNGVNILDKDGRPIYVHGQ